MAVNSATRDPPLTTAFEDHRRALPLRGDRALRYGLCGNARARATLAGGVFGFAEAARASDFDLSGFEFAQFGLGGGLFGCPNRASRRSQSPNRRRARASRATRKGKRQFLSAGCARKRSRWPKPGSRGRWLGRPRLRRSARGAAGGGSCSVPGPGVRLRRSGTCLRSPPSDGARSALSDTSTMIEGERSGLLCGRPAVRCGFERQFVAVVCHRAFARCELREGPDRIVGESAGCTHGVSLVTR